jgi:segregation and condensation protein A
MAATLLQIKSRQLLPFDDQEETEAEESDPRRELVRRLLEYQQYKEAGMLIGARALLGREVFSRSMVEPEITAARDAEAPMEASLFELVNAFRSLLVRIPAESFHDVAPEDSFSIADSINEILSLLQEQDTVRFDDIVSADYTRDRAIVTFLALLELCRLKMVRIFQGSDHGSIWFVPAVAAEFFEV